MRRGSPVLSGVAFTIIACSTLPAGSDRPLPPELAGSPWEHRPTNVDAAVQFVVYPPSRWVTPCPDNPANARCTVYDPSPFHIRFSLRGRTFVVPTNAYNMKPRVGGPHTAWYKVPSRGSLEVHVDHLGAAGDTLSRGSVTIPLVPNRAWLVVVSQQRRYPPHIPKPPCMACAGDATFPIVTAEGTRADYDLRVYWGWRPITGPPLPPA